MAYESQDKSSPAGNLISASTRNKKRKKVTIIILTIASIPRSYSISDQKYLESVRVQISQQLNDVCATPCHPFPSSLHALVRYFSCLSFVTELPMSCSFHNHTPPINSHNMSLFVSFSFFFKAKDDADMLPHLILNGIHLIHDSHPILSFDILIASTSAPIRIHICLPPLHPRLATSPHSTWHHHNHSLGSMSQTPLGNEPPPPTSRKRDTLLGSNRGPAHWIRTLPSP
ncbi:hypothetical protein BKA61DRAFT_3593 [Leptodontidium sp. MPI-SDFR-AT-0119]|nr:hypothetical protein BKA61DRAFT_3593 [Leptodontidium sp. MPI-SDFR-AT-0119]